MADYNFREIEKKWQEYWEAAQTFRVQVDHKKTKFYVLDMFPYPSGAGLHVGHPLGYIASDIVARYKKLRDYNVLHPMGYDSFGLPAEQYAIQTGQHPAVTTEENINRYTQQLKNIGFAFDWKREVRTSDPSYYKWTQWIFMQLFDSYYDKQEDKAKDISTLIKTFEESGNLDINTVCDDETPSFTADEWNSFSETKQQKLLLHYRLAYLAETSVNWCAELGTVLSNDEVKDGFSERGGYPVIQKKMMQWNMRIAAYAERLLSGLENLQWSDAIKEMQRNWIGKSIGAEMVFRVEEHDLNIKIFTTRIDTIFGATYLALAPENELVDRLASDSQKQAVDDYVKAAKSRSERDRMSDVKTISGVFTGSYATNPFNGEKIPIWVADYVLAGYGTGAVMAVPAHDERDYNFAKHFGLEIRQVIEGSMEEGSFPGKDGTITNSDFLNGLKMKAAIDKAISFLEENRLGRGRIQYKMRDAIFTRQRYWGEPLPVYFKDGIPYLIDEKDLPLVLPGVDKFLPTEEGEPPLGRAKNWTYKTGDNEYPLELSTMPGWAGSSWYFVRYMDSTNSEEFVNKEIQDYWESVDLYIGGSEHATGHLLYSRFWTKFLYDKGYVTVDEPFKKMINQGMIQGRSSLVYRVKGTNQFVSYHLKDSYDTIPMHVDVNIVHNDQLNLEKFRAWRKDLADADFILENGKYICGSEIEKMSKSKFNVVNPDDIIERYGADTLRLYEMFLGPLEQFKPWNTNGIDGVFKFLKKLWRLYHDQDGNLSVSESKATKEELKILHKTIKKAEEDMESYSFNTSVSSFMICVNELTALKCNKREILEPLTVIISPYAPHITEELWSLMGKESSVTSESFPAFKQEYVEENFHEYPVSINGKVRVRLPLPLNLSKEEIEEEAMGNTVVQKWIEGKTPKKVIVVPGRIVNIVV